MTGPVYSSKSSVTVGLAVSGDCGECERDGGADLESVCLSVLAKWNLTGLPSSSESKLAVAGLLFENSVASGLGDDGMDVGVGGEAGLSSCSGCSSVLVEMIERGDSSGRSITGTMATAPLIRTGSAGVTLCSTRISV